MAMTGKKINGYENREEVFGEVEYTDEAIYVIEIYPDEGEVLTRLVSVDDADEIYKGNKKFIKKETAEIMIWVFINPVLNEIW